MHTQNEERKRNKNQNGVPMGALSVFSGERGNHATTSSWGYHYPPPSTDKNSVKSFSKGNSRRDFQGKRRKKPRDNTTMRPPRSHLYPILSRCLSVLVAAPADEELPAAAVTWGDKLAKGA